MGAASVILAIAVPLGGAAAASVTWFLGGSGSDLPSCAACEVSLPPSGTSTFGSTQNVGNDQLSPNVAVVASDLSVHIEVPPGTGAVGASRSFFLFVRGDPSKRLRCDIAGVSSTCTSGAQTLAIPANSRLLIDALNSGNAPATKVQFSWRATTP
jgi:hypothetical protein